MEKGSSIDVVPFCEPEQIATRGHGAGCVPDADRRFRLRDRLALPR
jgi:hypothetical protein